MISISETAKAYFLAAERCEEQKQINSNQTEWLLVPAITNRAFSIELYFKAIFENDGISKKGHKLLQLFEELGQERQLQIIKETGIDPQIFSSDLNKISNSFVEWRYLYEKNDIQIAWRFLQTLSIAVKSVFEKLPGNP